MDKRGTGGAELVCYFNDMPQIGFGGSCHWCTEAVFQSLIGVKQVQQGWIASGDLPFSEAVLVDYAEKEIDLDTLIAVHLHSHSCTAVHSMREKYRSAVYVFNNEQAALAKTVIQNLQSEFDSPIITQVLRFGTFKLNSEEYLNYYANNPDKPFCQNYITPKLRALTLRFGTNLKI